MWWRVFGLSDAEPNPAALLEHLHARGLPAAGHFRGDDLGWTGGELSLDGGAAPIVLERYLTGEDDLRDELNTWAAWLETRDREPAHRALMQHFIGTRQLITLRQPADSQDPTLDRLATEVCRHLARQTDGVYQADGRGFFAADGALLLPED
jgi:hypothetical protein